MTYDDLDPLMQETIRAKMPEEYRDDPASIPEAEAARIIAESYDVNAYYALDLVDNADSTIRRRVRTMLRATLPGVRQVISKTEGEGVGEARSIKDIMSERMPPLDGAHWEVFELDYK